MLTFKPHELPNLNFKKAVKKPIAIQCIQINEPFIVETLEGVMKGKKGDWLMIGVSGEIYPCNQVIFDKTYNVLK